MSTVANTILEQLGGASRLKAMIGAHSFHKEGKILIFKWKAKAHKGAKAVRITLEPSDTYKMEFFAQAPAPTFEVKITATYEDVYNDQLVEIFERETGLYLSL